MSGIVTPNDMTSNSVNIAPPPPVTGLTTTVNSQNAITLTWASGGGTTTGFKIMYATTDIVTDCSTGTEVPQGSITGSSHMVTGLNQAHQYFFRVCALNDNNNVDTSNGVSANDFTDLASGQIKILFKKTFNATGISGKVLQLSSFVGDIDKDGKDDYVENYSNAGGIDSYNLKSQLNSIFSFSLPEGLSAVPTTVTSAGDYNNDGTDDLVVGALLFEDSGIQKGIVKVLSGTNGSELFSQLGNNHFGARVGSMGDLNGDGYSEIFTVEHGSSHSFKIFSGIDNSVLHNIPGTAIYSAANIGDYNNDGKNDYAIIDGTNIKVYSGLDNSILFSVTPTTDIGNSHFVKAAGDLNNDGFADLVVGLPEDNSSSGKLIVYSGQDNSIIFSKTGSGFTKYMGLYASSFYDFNNDGYNDLLVCTGSLVGDPNNIYIYSGNNGAELLATKMEAPYDSSPQVCDGTGDYNGDGKNDILIYTYINPYKHYLLMASPY